MLPAPQAPVYRVSQRRFASLRTISALMLREMSTQYGRTPGGFVWTLLEPLAAVAFLSIGFSLLLRSPSLGTSFLMFYATGYMMYVTFHSISNVVARAIRFSLPLLKYPAVSWVDAVIARLLLKAMTNALVMTIMLSGIILVTGYRSTIDPVPVVVAFISMVMLGAGVGLINCVIMGLFPIWDVAWSILTRPLFLGSAILYIYEDLPSGLAQDILWYNPIVHASGLNRAGFYPIYSPAYISLEYVFGVSMVLIALGLILMRRYQREIQQM